MIGALMAYVSTPRPGEFQPMKPNFGIMPALGERVRGKRQRGAAYAARALASLPDAGGL